MKRIIPLVLALLFGLGGAAAAGVIGQSVIYRYDSTHSYAAIISRDYGDGSYVLVVLDPDGYLYGFPFGANSQAYLGVIVVDGIPQDESQTSDNRWHLNTAVPRAVVTATSTPTLTIGGSAVQLDATHDVNYTAVVKISATLSLSGGQAGHIDLVCDSSATPTTIVETHSVENTGTLTVGLSVVHSVTGNLRWRVPAGQYCKLTSTNDTGSPTYTLVRQSAQILGD